MVVLSLVVIVENSSGSIIISGNSRKMVVFVIEKL